VHPNKFNTLDIDMDLDNKNKKMLEVEMVEAPPPMMHLPQSI
jgi:hypothetical protein